MNLNLQKTIYKQPIEITEIIENRSFSLLRLIGYILLVFSLIDYIAIITPPRLTDPVWEFQTMSRLVDHALDKVSEIGINFMCL